MAQIKTNLLYGTTGNLPAVSGANLTSLNGTQVTSGTLPMARLSGTLPALNGSALTTLNGTQVTTGTVADARISALTSSKLTGNLPALNASALTNLDARDLENALPAISGASLTNLTAGKILQVQSATTTSVVTEGSGGTSFLDYISRTITPSATSSKILLLGTVAEPDQLDGRIKASFFRDSTEIATGGKFTAEFGRNLGYTGTEDHFFNMANVFYFLFAQTEFRLSR